MAVIALGAAALGITGLNGSREANAPSSIGELVLAGLMAFAFLRGFAMLQGTEYLQEGLPGRPGRPLDAQHTLREAVEDVTRTERSGREGVLGEALLHLGVLALAVYSLSVGYLLVFSVLALPVGANLAALGLKMLREGRR